MWNFSRILPSTLGPPNPGNHIPSLGNTHTAMMPICFSLITSARGIKLQEGNVAGNYIAHWLIQSDQPTAARIRMPWGFDDIFTRFCRFGPHKPPLEADYLLLASEAKWPLSHSHNFLFASCCLKKISPRSSLEVCLPWWFVLCSHSKQSWMDKSKLGATMISVVGPVG